MADTYVTSDKLPVTLWTELVKAGLVGRTIYVKMSHPDAEGSNRGATLRERIVRDIVERHFDKKPILKSELKDTYMVSDSLIEKAVAEAKKRLGLGSEFRYSKFRGGFVRRTQLKTHLDRKARVSRPGRIVRPKKEQDAPAKKGRKSSLPGFEKPFRPIRPEDLIIDKED